MKYLIDNLISSIGEDYISATNQLNPDTDFMSGGYGWSGEFTGPRVANKRPSFPALADGGDEYHCVDVDLGETKSPDCAAVVNTNATEIKVLFSETGNSGTWNEAGSFEGPGNKFIQFPSATHGRYWRFVLYHDEWYLKIGELMLGTSTQLSRVFKWGLVVGRRYENVVHESPGLIPWRYGHNPHSIKSFSMQYSGLTRDQFEEIETLYDALKGSLNPVLIAPYAHIPSRAHECHYVFLDDELEEQDMHTNDKHTVLVFQEHPFEISDISV